MEKRSSRVEIESRSQKIKASTRAYFFVSAVVVFAVWLTALPGDFVWIDRSEILDGGYRVNTWSDLGDVWTHSLDQYLERNQGSLSSQGGYLRPIYALSLSLDWMLWQRTPWLYHVENLAWHLLVVYGLYCIGKQFLRSLENGERIAFWSALLFAVHPLGVHSTTWISGRKDLLCAGFGLMSLIAFGRVCDLVRADSVEQQTIRAGHRIKSLVYSLASIIFLLLAVFSKELAYVVPIFASFWVWFQSPSPSHHSDVRSRNGILGCLGMLWSAAGAAFIYRMIVIHGPGLGSTYPDSSFINNVGNFVRLWWSYVGRTLYPIDPTIVDRWRLSQGIGPVEIVAGLGLIAVGTTVLVGVSRRWSPMLLVLWYIVWMLPASGLLPLRHVYAERYLYPAMWGLIGVVVFLIFHVFDSRQSKVRLVILCGLFCWLSFETATENRYWWNDEDLFERAVAQDPQYVEGRIGLAALSLTNGDFERVVEESLFALKSAHTSGYVSYWSPFVANTNLGLALQRLGRYQDAERHFTVAQESRPDNAISHYHLGLNAAALGDFLQAEQHYKKALKIKPDDFLTQSNLGHVYLNREKWDECIGLLGPLVQLQPGDSLNRSNLGTAFLLSGRYLEAEEQFEAIVLTHRDVAVHHAKLAWAEWKQDKRQEAQTHILKAIELDPNHPTVRHVATMVLRE